MTLPLATRIFLGYAVVLLTFGGVSVYSVSELHRSQAEIQLVAEGYLSLSQTVAAMEAFITNQARDTERLRQATDLETRLALMRLTRLYLPRVVAERLAQARETARRVHTLAPAPEQAFVADASARIEELAVQFADYEREESRVFLLLSDPRPSQSDATAGLDRLQQLETALLSSIRRLHGSLQARIRERVRQAQERGQRTEVAIILLPIVAMGVGLIATGVAARTLRPVRTLIEGIARIRQGDFEAQLKLKGADEIAQLAREFDAMARALKERDALLKQKQEELLRAERLAAVGRVSAQVAHEVRNPLSSIGLNAEMLAESLEGATFAGEAQKAEARELLASVTREVDRVTEITEDYLRLARLPAPVLREENVVSILEDCLTFLRPELDRATVTVNTTFPPLPLLLKVDEAQLRQVFLNLVRNAREAMEAGGTLSVSAWRAQEKAEIRIQDTGVGMSPEVVERIFEPFFTTKRGGTGLGLSLARQIVEAHGGAVGVNTQPGKGTTFVLTFPAVG